MIRNRLGRPVAYTHYDLVWDGEVLDTIGPEQGGMTTVMMRVALNPGMGVVARVTEFVGELDDVQEVHHPPRTVLPIS